MRIAKNEDVLPKDQIVSGMHYFLRQLPCGIKFEHKGERYETMTHLKYNTGPMNGKSSRPYMNDRTNKGEEFFLSEEVIVI